MDLSLTERFPVPGGLQVAEERFTISEIIKLRAALHPEKKAFTYLHNGIEESESVTFGQLHQSVMNLAGYLMSKNLQGSRVLMFYPAGLDFVKAFFACLQAGIVAVPAYPPRKNRSLGRIHAMVNDCQPAAILATEAIARDLERNFNEDSLLNKIPWIITDEISGSDEWIAESTPSPDSLAFLQYTSGSTGNPKGVMVSHLNIMVNSYNLHRHFHTSGGTCSVLWLPQFHDMGLVLGMLQPVYAGYHAVFMSPVNFVAKPENWLNAISNFKATLTGGPNFSFELCSDKISETEKSEIDLSSLQMIFNGAEPVRAETLNRFYDEFKVCGLKPGTIFPGYGMAETTLSIAVLGVKHKRLFLQVDGPSLSKNLVVPVEDGSNESLKIVSVGVPEGDTLIKIVNPETFLESNTGEVGEIWVNGLSVAAGYWNNEQLTGELFKARLSNSELAWLRTGDLGFIYEGELYVTGRLKDLIIIRGRNYYPHDIEEVAGRSHKSIRKSYCAAFSADYHGSEQLVIVAELERTFLRKPNSEEIIRLIIQDVSGEFEIQPYRVSLVKTGSLFKTSSGKLMRKAIKNALFNNEFEIIAEHISSVNPGYYSENTEESISVLDFLMKWVSVELNQGEEVNADLPISAYGIDSLKAMELTDKTKSLFGFEWPPYLFFEDMSIQKMAEEGENLR